jgi:hypothetical protein
MRLGGTVAMLVGADRDYPLGAIAIVNQPWALIFIFVAILVGHVRLTHTSVHHQLAVEDSEKLTVRLGIHCGQGKSYKEVFPVRVSSGVVQHEEMLNVILKNRLPMNDHKYRGDRCVPSLIY